MAILGEPLGVREEREAGWDERLAELPFDPSRNLVDWTIAKIRPSVSLAVRLALLERKLDVVRTPALCDWSRLSQRVVHGNERICFWGEPKEVQLIREWIRLAYRPSERDLAELELGTITYVKERQGDEMILIADHLASTLSGSVPSIAVGMLTVRAMFDAGAVAMRSEIRNRQGGGDAPSGMAGHRLAVRELHTSYWGVVPWYVGWGAQELLDYYELPNDPQLTRRLIAETGDMYLAADVDRSFAAALVSLNLDCDYQAADRHRTAGSHRSQVRWEVRAPAPLLMPWQRIVIEPSHRGEHLTLRDALRAADRLEQVACVTAEIPIEDPGFLDAQRELTAAGFDLGALAPPIATRRGRHGFVGLWSRCLTGLPVAAPYYLCSRLLNSRERSVAAHIGRLSAAWDGASATTGACTASAP